jgi:hypothetical protein
VVLPKDLVTDLDLDPETASALFERTAPDLGAPKALLLETGPPLDVARWGVRTEKGAWRMKVAVAPAARARLRRGAGVLSALAPHAEALAPRGLVLPRLERLLDGGGAEGPDLPTVVVEARLGTADAASRWDRLAPGTRTALSEPLAKALATLHALPAADARRALGSPSVANEAEANRGVGDGAALPRAGPQGWREAVRVGVERRVGRVRAAGALDADVLARVEARLLSEVEAMPADVPRRLCHGRVRPSSIALESPGRGRSGFAGLRDLEEARAADPLTDVALWLLSTGDPAGRAARGFLDAFRRASAATSDGPSPGGAALGAPGWATRLDSYFGLEVLRVVSETAEGGAPDAVEAMCPAVEAWCEGAWRPSEAPAPAPRATAPPRGSVA